MHLQLQQQSTLLGRKPSGFTEHYYTEWDDGLGKERISLFLVMSIESTQVPGAEIGKEAFQLLQDHFLNDLAGDPYDRFEAALREVNTMVNEKEKELELKFVPNVHVVVGVIQKDMLFLSQRGHAQGYLLRQRHVSSITDGLCDEKNKEDLFQNIASGVLEVEDAVILTTGNLVQYVTPNDLSKIFSEQSLGEASEELQDMLEAEMEEQMALLSFEILEKLEDPAAEIAENTFEQTELPTPAPKKDSKAAAQLEKATSMLRDWLRKQEKMELLNRLKAMERKRLLQLIGGVAGVTVVTMGLLFFTSGKQRLVAEMEQNLQVAEENITQAETRGSFDKEEATQLLNEAESLAVKVLDSGHLGGQASQLLDRIDQQRDYIDNVIRVDDEAELIADFGSLLGSADIQGVVPYDDRIVVYTANEAYQVLIDEVQNPDNIDSSERIVEAAYFADQQNIVMISETGNVLEYDSGNVQIADTSDVEWNPAVDVQTYSSRIYLLDAENAQIWRYQRGTSGYGGAVAYLADETVDLSGALSMAIDGYVWVLNKGGELIQLLSGEAVSYSISDAPLVDYDEATKIFTSLEVNQLYVMEPAKNRVLMFNKSASSENITYNSQYVFDDLKGDLVDMYYDIDRNVLVFVTDSALYELGF